MDFVIPVHGSLERKTDSSLLAEKFCRRHQAVIQFRKARLWDLLNGP